MGIKSNRDAHFAPSLTAEKATRKSVAKTSRELSRRLASPVRTLEAWEEGRRQPEFGGERFAPGDRANPEAGEDVAGEGQAPGLRGRLRGAKDLQAPDRAMAPAIAGAEPREAGAADQNPSFLNLDLL